MLLLLKKKLLNKTNKTLKKYLMLDPSPLVVTLRWMPEPAWE